jgi:outer membrane usher protein
VAQPHGTAAVTAPGARAATATDSDVIVTVRTNGVERGEFILVRKADGDFWIPAQDFPRLKLQPNDSAMRQNLGQAYFSFRALGASNVAFDESLLTLDAVFPTTGLETTHIDLANLPAPLVVGPPSNSWILNYRAAASQSSDDSIKLRLSTELNMRFGNLLLRQEVKYDSRFVDSKLVRGNTQLIWDDRRAGTRLVVGDVIVPGGPIGSTFPGAGLSFSRLFAITPDVIRQPGAALQASTLTPADIEVSVDGSPLYRAHVGPGPISVDNLFYTGGARTVRLIVTDATGRRQVIEQPFLFTDSVLAKGLHEYSYFVGRRSELDSGEQWRYREGAWQGFHRYGANDSLTLEAGGEGTREFASGGGGATLRSNLFGLLSLDLLGSLDRVSSRRAKGWAARYTYLAPNLSLFLGRRYFGDGFLTLASTAGGAPPRSENRIGATTRLFDFATLSADLVRGRDAEGATRSYAVRLSSNLDRRTSINAEYQALRSGGVSEWAVNLFLRYELDQQGWISTSVRTAANSHGVDVEAGKQLVQGEGVGYRVGVTSNSQAGQASSAAFGSANWNLKPMTLAFNGTSQLQGGRSHYVEGSVSGSVVGLDGYVGLTREVGDGFALARLGVAQPGVDIFLNNQSQGKTNKQGNLLIPQVGAYGRQDVSLDDKQLPMQYTLASKRVTIAPPYKSGTVVDFGGHKVNAVTGFAWQVQGAQRTPIASRSWELIGSGGRLKVETAASGDFYLEDAAPGNYAGRLEIEGQAYSCQMTVPVFAEAVFELKEGIICE